MKALGSLLVILLLLSSCGDDTTDVSMNFRLKYGGEPLVMLDNYTYPDGRTIRFTRVSFYLSDIEALEGNNATQLKDAEMFNFSTLNDDLASAAAGYTYTITDAPVSDIDGIRFNIGLNPTLNGLTPVDFDSDHALSNTGEYWGGWKSYIFVKFEGFIDLDEDGTAESTFALHLGSDDIMRTAQFSNPDIIDGTALFNFEIDMEQVFDNGTIYDIVETTNIHSLNQINQANFLIDNFQDAFIMDNN